MYTGARLTPNAAVLFQEGWRAGQGVRHCGGRWGDSRGARRHDGVTRRRVITSVPVNLHIQQQLIIFHTPGRGSETNWSMSRSGLLAKTGPKVCKS